MADSDRSVEDVAHIEGTPSEEILTEARKRYERATEWYSEFNRRFLEDLKFAYGDSDNQFQWPNSVRQSRDIDQRPCLTMNIVRQHNLQITNRMRQNKSDVRILGTGGGASAESADALKHFIKFIEYSSNAEAAYSQARRYMVDGGKGCWRLVTRWAEYQQGMPGSGFDQDIFIEPVRDPLTVLADPDARRKDKSDGRWLFAFDVIPKSEFKDAYPEIVNLLGDIPLGGGDPGGDWLPKDHIMICEYFRKVPQIDTLVSFVYGGMRHVIRRSEMPDEIWDALKGDPLTKTRELEEDLIEWYLIAGDQVVDSTTWPGKYIPFIFCLGEEHIIDGIYDCKGHTRAMKDAQRIFNYNASASVEFGALQTKVPWVVPMEGIEQYMTVWETANLINHAFLPYKSFNEMSPEKPIPPPFRPDPPQPAPVYQNGMDTAFNWMMMTSGQWQNQMGMMGNERTGDAIARRQDQGDTATYHYQDEYAEALRFTYKQLIDLIPRIYDTRRAKRIMTEDGFEYDLVIDPSLRQAYMLDQQHQSEVIRRVVLNPSVGVYDVAADVGPATTTQRQETLEALTLLLTQAPALTGILGDIFIRNMDFKDAPEAARRMYRMVPPQALGQGPTPQEQQLQVQVGTLQGALAKAMQRAGQDRLEVKNKERQGSIEGYRAETDRIKALVPLLGQDPQDTQKLITQLVQDTLATHLLPILQALPGSAGNGASQAEAPVEGSTQAPDGEWYLQDPTRMGKYLRVVPLAQERKPKGIIGNQ